MLICSLFVFFGGASSLHLNSPDGEPHSHGGSMFDVTKIGTTTFEGGGVNNYNDVGLDHSMGEFAEEAQQGSHGNGQGTVSQGHHNHVKNKMTVKSIDVNEHGHNSLHSSSKLFNANAPASVDKVYVTTEQSILTDLHDAWGSGAGTTRGEGSGDLQNLLNTAETYKSVTKPGKSIEQSSSTYDDHAKQNSGGHNFDKMRYDHSNLDYWAEGGDYQKNQIQGNKVFSEKDSHASQSNLGVKHYDTAVACTCENGVAARTDCLKDKPQWCRSCSNGQTPGKQITEGVVQSLCQPLTDPADAAAIRGDLWQGLSTETGPTHEH